MKNVFNRLMKNSSIKKNSSIESPQTLMQSFFVFLNLREKYPRGQHQKVQQTPNLNVRYKRKRKPQGRNILIIMSENYPHLLTDIKPQIQEAQRTQRTINSPPKNIKTYHIQTVDNNAQT